MRTLLALTLLALIAGCGTGDPDAAPETVTVTVGTSESAPEPTSEPPSIEPSSEEPPDTSEPPSSDGILAVGETFTTPRGGQVTLESIERRATGLGQFDSPPEEGVYLEVLIAGVAGPEGGELNPFGFTIVDAAGFRYDPTFGETSMPPLSSDAIPPGGIIRGAILFDIPEGPVQLVWSPTFGSEAAATWNIP